ncbi:MAG TPA: hypothetical protein VGO47_06190 [Chlamydiales bacterium]|nr:hypothetical protein [Chlamydiales bacterium]
MRSDGTQWSQDSALPIIPPLTGIEHLTGRLLGDLRLPIEISGQVVDDELGPTLEVETQQGSPAKVTVGRSQTEKVLASLRHKIRQKQQYLRWQGLTLPSLKEAYMKLRRVTQDGRQSTASLNLSDLEVPCTCHKEATSYTIMALYFDRMYLIFEHPNTKSNV